MSVSSKWVVSKIEGQSVSLYPVCRGIENREWASSTPGGSMTMFITNAVALEAFALYEEYEAVFTHRPKPARGDHHPVDPYVDHPAYDPSKTLHICKTCGSYASLNEDGTPDWTKHEEHFEAGPDLP